MEHIYLEALLKNINNYSRVLFIRTIKSKKVSYIIPIYVTMHRINT